MKSSPSGIRAILQVFAALSILGGLAVVTGLWSSGEPRGVDSVIRIQWNQAGGASPEDFSARMAELLGQIGQPSLHVDAERWIAEIDRPNTHLTVEYRLGEAWFTVRKTDYGRWGTLARTVAVYRKAAAAALAGLGLMIFLSVRLI